MQMLEFDWPCHCTLLVINVKWLGAVNKIATFLRFSEVLKERIKTNE